MLLLIAHLGAFVQRLLGEAAEDAQIQLNFIANPHRTRPEISRMTLVRRILDASAQWLNRLKPWDALQNLRKQAINACGFTGA
jgi:hypothetical protein